MNQTVDSASSLHAKQPLRGFVLWAIALVLYLVPGFVAAFRTAADLGPKLRDSARVAQIIRPAVSELYAGNVWLRAAFFVLLTWLLYLISRSVARHRSRA